MSLYGTSDDDRYFGAKQLSDDTRSNLVSYKMAKRRLLVTTETFDRNWLLEMFGRVRLVRRTRFRPVRPSVTNDAVALVRNNILVARPAKSPQRSAFCQTNWVCNVRPVV